MINPQWLELLVSRTNLQGPKDNQVIEVQLYMPVKPFYSFDHQGNRGFRVLANRLPSWLIVKDLTILEISGLNLCWGWSGGAKVSCSLCQRGIQLILAYTQLSKACYPCSRFGYEGWWGGMFYFFCFFTFILVLSFLSLSLISFTICSISFLPFSGRLHKITHKGWRVVKPQHNQWISAICSKFCQTDITKSYLAMTVLNKKWGGWHFVIIATDKMIIFYFSMKTCCGYSLEPTTYVFIEK